MSNVTRPRYPRRVSPSIEGVVHNERLTPKRHRVKERETMKQLLPNGLVLISTAMRLAPGRKKSHQFVNWVEINGFNFPYSGWYIVWRLADGQEYAYISFPMSDAAEGDIVTRLHQQAVDDSDLTHGGEFYNRGPRSQAVAKVAV
jgi:hypothetical protein